VFPVSIGIISVGSIIHGKNLYRKWYVDSSAMAAALATDYNNLYDNVVKEVGEDRAKELKYGIETQTVEERTVNDKGKEKVTKKKAKVVTDAGSGYILRWDSEFADEWVDDFESNYYRVGLILSSMESYIAARETHHMFWMEAVEQLFGSRGLKKILEDRKAKGLSIPYMGGWIYDSEKAKSINVDIMREPGTSNILICLIPDGNIAELTGK
jgi:Tfp pilus assembly major pilin PilA